MAKAPKKEGDTKPTQTKVSKDFKNKKNKRNWSLIKQDYLITPPSKEGKWPSNRVWCLQKKLPWPGSDKHMRGWKDERDDQWAEYARKAMEKSAARILESEGKMKARFYNMASRVLRICEKNLESLEILKDQTGKDTQVDPIDMDHIIKSLQKVQSIMHKAMGLDDIKLGVNLSADAVIALIRKLPASELDKLLEQFAQMDDGEFDA